MSTQFSKRELFSKHALGAGLGVGALALLAQPPRASADIPFTSFPFSATGATTPRTMPDRLAEVVNVKDFGAVGDGKANDTAAIQAAIDAAYGPASAPHGGTNYTLNRAVFFPAGLYIISAPIRLFMVHGAHIYGAGRFATTIYNASGGGCFVTNGLNYSRFEDMYLRCDNGSGAIVFDCNWDGSGRWAVQLQSNTFINMFFNGGTIGFRLAADGYQGDSHMLINCYIAAATQAGIYVAAQNAIQNWLIGGNISSCAIGMWGVGGFFDNYIGVNFTGNGTDIQTETNQGNGISITGCRSESQNFFHNAGGVPSLVAGCGHQSAQGQLGDFVFQSGGTIDIVGCESYQGRIWLQYWNNATIRNCYFWRSDWLTIYSGWHIANNNRGNFRATVQNVLNYVPDTAYQDLWVDDTGAVQRRNRHTEATAITDQNAVYCGASVPTTIPQIGTATVFQAQINGLAPNTPVAFKVTGGALPTGLVAEQRYYVIGVVITDITSSVFATANNHGLMNGDFLHFLSTGTFPTGLAPLLQYWVVVTSPTTFTLKDATGSAAITISSGYSGTLTYYAPFRNSGTRSGDGVQSPFQVSSTIGGASVSTSGALTGTCYVVGVKTYYVGDIITRTNAVAGESPGWICIVAGELNHGGTGNQATFVPLQPSAPGAVTFSNLPASPVTGQQYNVSDAQVITNLVGPTYRAVAIGDWGLINGAAVGNWTGGGSSQIEVRWNGANWTIVGM
jgi:hypothetical protein